MKTTRAQPMAKHQVDGMTWPEVREAARQGRIVLIPMAAIEQHGYHLPVDMDNRACFHVCSEAARRRPDLLLNTPLLPYGFNEHNMEFPGTVSIRMDIFVEYLFDVARSYTRMGFRRLMLVNGHGSNQMLANLAARRVVNETNALAMALPYWCLNAAKFNAELRESDSPGGTAHACEYETSIYLALRPSAVDMKKAVKELSPKWSKKIWVDLVGGSSDVHFVDNYSRYNRSGVEGDPLRATAAKGDKIIDWVVDGLVELAEDFWKIPIKPRRNRQFRPHD
ncbi:MAG: creatininase family protein [Verrucomicrobia bacterium]|nr:creatininase family protein [Verrucomicrobiota bacterium]